MSRINGLDKPVSRICFGCAGDIMQAGKDFGQVLDASLEAGITFYDTARCYGDSEVSLGNWVKSRGVREQVVILTKGCHPKPWAPHHNRVNAKAIHEDLETSLKKLQTDYVDLYLLHRDDTSVPVGQLIDALEEEKKAGKLLLYGVSNWTCERFAQAQEYAATHGFSGFSVNSPNFSLAEQVSDPWRTGSEAITLSGPEHTGDRAYYLEHKIPIVSYSSLGRGLFSGKFKASDYREASKAMDKYAMRGYYSEDNLRRLARVEQLAADKGASISQIALAYLLNQKLEVYPICSFSSGKHMQENVKAAEITLTERELAWLNLEV